MEFDFKSLKRKDLQRLCKKHGLRANSTNSQMADGLASLFKVTWPLIRYFFPNLFLLKNFRVFSPPKSMNV
ncbi:hypothetical protein KSP39_PZI006257 [Platanthera zijinensis]|uniref:SAP domain-containing protein n=1 Tax=Platanthera zijinensis TaxID=2320716 RepID=A0AAP0GAK1_9ASPA